MADENRKNAPVEEQDLNEILKIRRDKLKAMVDKWDAGQLDFTPTCSREVYGFQLYTMDGYLDVLRHRAFFENVEV